jgi:hypothetical protein
VIQADLLWQRDGQLAVAVERPACIDDRQVDYLAVGAEAQDMALQGLFAIGGGLIRSPP